jgi:hypothetical protein
MNPHRRAGVSYNHPLVVTADPRPSVSGGLESAQRRLARLSIPGGVEITELGETSLVVDFALFCDKMTATSFARKQRTETTYFDRLSDDLQRGGATHRGCAYLSYDGDSETYRVSEYVIRLPRPGDDLDHETAAAEVADLVEAVGPPTRETNVWVREKIERLGGSINSVRRGQNDILDALNDPYPHVGGRETSIGYPTFVEFVADLKRAYADEFDPPAFA